MVDGVACSKAATGVASAKRASETCMGWDGCCSANANRGRRQQGGKTTDGILKRENGGYEYP